MPSSFSRSPRLLKGAFVQFPDALVVTAPNIILFQYNPEALSRTLEVWTPSPPTGGEDEPAGPQSEEYALTAQPGNPRETLTLSLELDAADALEEAASHPVAVLSGIADRLAALEMLLYPQENSGIGGLIQDAANSLGIGGGSGATANRETVAPVLFTWGPGKIIPVRLTSFSVEEQAFSPSLYPLRAKVNVEMKLLFPSDLPADDFSFNKEMIKASYNFYVQQKKVLAASSISNSAESILGMLPF